MEKNALRILIALPTLNEFPNLSRLIPEIVRLFPDIDLLIIDDASTDGTVQYLSQIAKISSRINVIQREGKLGIGSAHILALKKGIERSYNFILTMDADLTHDISDISKFLNAKSQSPLVIGSRYLLNSRIRGWSVSRLILTKCGHLFTQLFFRSKVDMSSGFRLYNVSKIPIDAIKLNCPKDYEFFFTSVLVYKKLNLSISEVSISLNNRGSGKSKMRFNLLLKGVRILLEFAFRIRRIKI